ncbi:hypothetical protein HZH68_001977 [Vespula germanica]|uniref:Apple domain-containing protein n=1 Tax=Vespula germanica TaxID=30212 RepID=A0A834KV23_VESGE|nr:hypothetical protein HZH68_001977 [Vespula germanica]
MWGRGRRIERYHQKFLLIALQFFGLIRTSKFQDLTIDNQLVIVANDCYTRVSIGTKLPDKDISFTIKVDSISDCEEECSKRRNSCVAFGFGISLKGNTSCELSSNMPNPEELQMDSDYDVYLRTERLPHCEPDRLYKTSNSGNQRSKNNTRTNSRFSGGLFGSFLPNIYQPNRSENNGKRQNTSQQSYLSSFDDDQRIIDIVRNKNYGVRPKIPINDQKYSTFGINNESKLPTDKKQQLFGNNFGEKIYLEKGNENLFHFDRPVITKDDLYRPVTLIYRPTYDNVWQNKDFQNYGNRPINEMFSRPVTKINEECTKTLTSSPEDNYKKDFYKTDKDNSMIVKNYQVHRTTTITPFNENNYQIPVRWKPLQSGIIQQFRRNQTSPFVTNANENVFIGTNDYTNFMNDYNKKFKVPVNEENKCE